MILAAQRTPVEIWSWVIEIVIMDSFMPNITFVPGARPFFASVQMEDRGRQAQNIPFPGDFRRLCLVSRSWKLVVDSYKYLFKTRVFVPGRSSELVETDKQESVGRLIAAQDPFQYHCEPFDVSFWVDQLRSNPRVVHITIYDSYYIQDNLFRTLLSYSTHFRALTSLELQLQPRNEGIASSLSTHFPWLIHLDIRIRLGSDERSITDLMDLHLPHLLTMRWDTDRWSLFDEAFPSWKLPSLRAIILTANGNTYPDSNPTAATLQSFFLKFGHGITHACLYVCVKEKEDPIKWDSVPCLEELIAHPAVQFDGPAPPESKLDRITVTNFNEPCIDWLAATFGPVQRQGEPSINHRKVTICLEYEGGHDAANRAFEDAHNSLYRRAAAFNSFCRIRQWGLEIGTGMPWVE